MAARKSQLPRVPLRAARVLFRLATSSPTLPREKEGGDVHPFLSIVRSLETVREVDL